MISSRQPHQGPPGASPIQGPPAMDAVASGAGGYPRDGH